MSNRRQPRRQQAPRTKVVTIQKPPSEQQKRAITKEFLAKDATLPLPTLAAADKAELSPGDIRLHLPAKELNKLYYKVAHNLSVGKGRANFSPGAILGSGTVKFTVKLNLDSENALKMTAGVANSAVHHAKPRSDSDAKAVREFHAKNVASSLENAYSLSDDIISSSEA